MHAREELPGTRAAGKGNAPRPSAVTPTGDARAPLSPATILALQRSAGNAAVSRALAADQAAHGAGCDHETVHGADPAGPRALVDAAMSSSGRPVDRSTRTELESYYQNDFAAARIHDDAVAQRAAAAVGAEAYTLGTHVFLGSGANRKEVIGHEFGHVDKNIKGVAETGSDNGAGVSVTDPGQASERAAAADGAAFAAGARIAPSVATRPAATPGAGAGVAVQRVLRASAADVVEVQPVAGNAAVNGIIQRADAAPEEAIEPAFTFDARMGANPHLFTNGTQNFWVGTPPAPDGYWTMPGMQHCAYMATYWLRHEDHRGGLRFLDFAAGDRRDASMKVRSWADRGGGAAQVQYAATELHGAAVQPAVVIKKAAAGALPPGTQIWFGTDSHAEAALVTEDGKFLMYDPNTGATTKRTSQQFCQYMAGKNAAVVHYGSAVEPEAGPAAAPEAGPAAAPKAGPGAHPKDCACCAVM